MSKRTLRWVLADQLDPKISSLKDADPETDVIFLCEVAAEATYVRHHKKKIAFLFSAMRHFAEEMREAGFTVHYVHLDDEGNAGSFPAELKRAVDRLTPERVVVTEAGEWRVMEQFCDLGDELDVPFEVRDDDRFVCSHAEFRAWAEGRKTLTMEFFYREMRRKTGLLMDGDEPVGGKWNYDAENRDPLPAEVDIPPRPSFPTDAVTQACMRLVEERFGDHFGALDDLAYPVTRADAERYLDHFVDDLLMRFGDYQDAMRQGEPLLFHAHLSGLVNCGLLNPLEICRRAETAYEQGRAPLNAAEGFIRQVIGWREYVRGLYWLLMPDYAKSNFLDAERPVPDFYWTGETEMNCLRQCITETHRFAYAHHIQRLMVLGNFALLAGLRPWEVEEWYLLVYWDAYEWVELPNVHGMILYADGGVMGSKPYAASGAYINRMSDYCRHCRYDVKQRTGPDACPFNYLYWDFVARNRAKLEDNRRMRMIYRSLDRMDEGKVAAMREAAAGFLGGLVGYREG